MTPVKVNEMRKIVEGGKVQLSALLAVAVSIIFLDCVRADVTWPADFWTQVTNSMALPAGTQIGTGTESFAVSTVTGNAELAGGTGTAANPFDSRWRTYGESGGTSLDTRPVGVVLTFR